MRGGGSSGRARGGSSLGRGGDSLGRARGVGSLGSVRGRGRVRGSGIWGSVRGSGIFRGRGIFRSILGSARRMRTSARKKCEHFVCEFVLRIFIDLGNYKI